MKLFLKILAAVLAAVLLYCVLFVFMTGAFYRRGMKDGGLCRIPGLGDGFIPQGLAQTPDGRYLLVCGYFSEKKCSRVYVIDQTDSYTFKYVDLLKADGGDYTGHAGGISVCGDTVYVSNASKLFYLPLASLIDAEPTSAARFTGSVEVGVRASFTFADADGVWVGDYCKGKDYATNPENHLTAPDGSEYGALIYFYPADASVASGIAAEPALVLSVRDMVQGFCVTSSGSYVLSCSSGLADSHLYVYDGSGSDGEYTYQGKTIPLVYLDSARLRDTIKLPHMSEDLEYDRDTGSVYVNFEACARKYGAGILPFSVGTVRIVRIG